MYLLGCSGFKLNNFGFLLALFIKREAQPELFTVPVLRALYPRAELGQFSSLDVIFFKSFAENKYLCVCDGNKYKGRAVLS
jgi:hypothetical protein